MAHRCLLFSTLLPEPSSTAAGRRLVDLIQLLQSAGSEVSICYAAPPSPFSVGSDLFAKTLHIDPNNAEADHLLREFHPDIVIFDRFVSEDQFGWRVRALWPDAMTVLDTEDLHFLRKNREERYLKGIPCDDAHLSDIAKREIASILRCDLSLIISDFEYDLLRSRFNIDPDLLCYVPLFGEFKKVSKSFEDRRHFISLGNFLHSPNWHTVLILKQWWLKIRRMLPDAELHIYGAYTPQKAFQLHDEKSGFLVCGRAESSSIMQNYRVMLAPIPYGAGQKGKLLEAMEYGTPSVTTPCGAEGMTDNPSNWNGFVCDNEESFIQQAETLYTQPDCWLEKQRIGADILQKWFNKEYCSAALLARIHHIYNNREEHRAKNYFGQILQHHTLRATEYLSKYITEKNKSKN